MLPDLNQRAANQARPTLHTKLATDVLLDYAHNRPNEMIRYHFRTKEMILHVEQDTAYLFMKVSRSRITGNYYLSDHNIKPTNPSDINPNGPIIT